ncbi:MAG TPA: UbiD family decarboxylase [Gaiellaceae bacterium]|jgi:UbiD family decarboxylase
MGADLRSFLELLDEHGLLARVERRVDPGTEAARLMRALELRGQAGLFTQVGDAQMSLAYNLVGTREALALALGVEPGRIHDRFREALEHRVGPVLVADAPVHEVIEQGEDADLRRLPLVTHSEKDAAPYITAGAVIARDPQTGRRNVSINRVMLAGAREAGIRMMPPQQLGVIQAQAEEAGRDLPVAIAIGLHPLDTIAAATSLPPGEDEFELAGGLRGEPLRLARAVSCDLEVPADAEIVIEGVILAGVREPEGPFGDFLQFYVPEMQNHRLRITAISHRSRPIYQTMVAGSREDVNILGLSREAEVVAAVEQTGAEVVDLRLGPTILGCTIAIRQRFDGEAKNVGLAALGAYQWLKYCVVVDHDVDVNDLEDVWWAVTARSSPERAIRVIAGAPAFPRDAHDIHGSRAIIDATIPFGEWAHYERRIPPGGAQLDLADWIA